MKTGIAGIAAVVVALGLTSLRADDAAKKDIVETAVAAGKFKTLATALKAADLIETLKGEGPFTVFAPNDDAFAKIAKSDLEALLADKDKLTKVLTFHVIKGNVMAADAIKLDGKNAKTVAGIDLPVSVKGGSVYVGNSKVIATDIQCKNGVIHVIDTVLLPK